NGRAIPMADEPSSETDIKRKLEDPFGVKFPEPKIEEDPFDPLLPTPDRPPIASPVEPEPKWKQTGSRVLEYGVGICLLIGPFVLFRALDQENVGNRTVLSLSLACLAVAGLYGWVLMNTTTVLGEPPIASIGFYGDEATVMLCSDADLKDAVRMEVFFGAEPG